LVVLWGNVKYY